MRERMKQALAVVLSELLILLPLVGCGGRTAPPKVPLTSAVFNPLHEELQRSYLELFDRAPTLEFSRSQLDSMNEYLNQANEYCVSRFEKRADDYEKQLDEAQSELRQKSRHLSEEQRHGLHCRIQNSRILRNQANMLADHAIPVAYDNQKAKLKLIEEWPADLNEIRQKLKSGAYHDRQYGDVKDIGFRNVGEGQKDDVKDGQEAIERMKRQDLLPEEIENDYIRTYLTELSKKIAAKSDLRVPVKVTALNAKEINAFALPGGFLFIQRGLLEQVEDEAQLAGVVAHEIAHAAARHGHKLMTKATIASILYQAAQVAALIATGGVAGIGTYYALRYGFFGLSLLLNLQLLGVSREFELEADRLGAQYAWNSGYDPSGFIRFFDKMATREGYVEGTSWFRTHPPFYQRMVQTKEEMMYLPDKNNLITNTPEFKRMKKELETVTAEAKEEEKGRPSLKTPEQGCPEPEKVEYEPGQPITTICSVPQKS